MASDFTFAYGHNMHLENLKRWLEKYGYDSRKILGFKVAFLEGYDLVWNFHACSGRGGAANIEPREGSRVWGVLIEFEEDLLRAFDHKENHPTAYSRGKERIPVFTIDGRRVPAWVYIARPNYGGRRDVWPTRAYKELLVSAAQEHGLPRVYVARLREVPEKKEGRTSLKAPPPS